MRRKTIRCQRIESEQRRDELRDGPDGYHRLKDALPMFNQKSCKVSLLDRGKCRLFCTSDDDNFSSQPPTSNILR